MAHPLVDQLRFTRSEWLRGLQDIGEEDGARHFGPMNCISWTVGHLAWQEQRYWLIRPQGRTLSQRLIELCSNGGPMTTPSLAEMLDLWHQVTQAADPFLDALTAQSIASSLSPDRPEQTVGSGLLRMMYHYWYHIGEIQAIRQMLNHADLPQFVGDIETQAPYRPE
jgi:DinB superfamily